MSDVTYGADEMPPNCGCQVACEGTYGEGGATCAETGIVYCPTHAAAFRLADALTASMPLYDLGVDAATEGERSLEDKRAAQAILARNRALLREIGRG